MRLRNGQRFHVSCWWREELRARFEVIEGERQRVRARLSEARSAAPVPPAARVERFESAPPAARRRAEEQTCALCGQPLRTGAPGYRSAGGAYHVACWEVPSTRASWLLFQTPPGSNGRTARETAWANPSTPIGDPICLLCAEGIEVAQPVVFAQGWLAHARCWTPEGKGGPDS